MVTALLAVALAVSPQTVTFSHPCAHSSVVLAALGKELGIKMAPGGSVLEDYFAVKFTSREPETIKRLIAETLNAVWVQRGEYLVLDRGPVQHAAERKAEDDLIRTEIEAYAKANEGKQFDIKALRDQLVINESLRGSSEAYREAVSATSRLLPDAFVGARVVRGFGIDNLLKVDPGTKQDFDWSESGGSTMPLELVKVVRDFLKDTSAFDEIAASLGLGTSSEYGVHGVVGSGTVRITVTREHSYLSITLDHRIESESSSSRWSRTLASFHRRYSDLPVPDLGEIEGSLIMSEPASSVIAVLRSKASGLNSDSGQRATRRQFEDCMAYASHLRQNEVLGDVCEPVLRAICDRKNRDYVALLPDNLVSMLASEWNRPTMGLAELWKLWTRTLEVSEDSATKTLCISPREPSSARELRFGRNAVSGLVSRYAANDSVDLGSLASLSVATRDMRSFYYDLSSAVRFLPVPRDYFGEYAAIRTYASLSQNERRQAAAGGVTMPWSRLPAYVQAVLQERLSGSSNTYGSSPPEPPGTGSVAVGYKSAGPPRLALLTSLPPGIEVRVIVARESGLKPKAPVGVSTSLASIEQIAQSTRVNVSGNLMLDYSKLAVVTFEELQVELFVPGYGFTAMKVYTDNSSDETKYYTHTELPEPYKSRLQEAIRKIGGGQ